MNLERELGDGRSVYLQKQLFTWKLAVGPTGAGWLDDAY